MVERGGLAHRGVDLGLDRAADAQVAPGDHAMVQVRAAGLGGIAHVETHASRLEVATVADLAAGLGVERRLVENHDTLLALLQALDGLAVPEQRDDLPGAGDALIAKEAGLTVDLDKAVVVHAECAGSAGALALGLHLALEALLVDGQLALAGDVIGQVDREAIGVVQLEHHVAGNHAALQFGKVLFEDLQALLRVLANCSSSVFSTRSICACCCFSSGRHRPSRRPALRRSCGRRCPWHPACCHGGRRGG